MRMGLATLLLFACTSRVTSQVIENDPYQYLLSIESAKCFSKHYQDLLSGSQSEPIVIYVGSCPPKSVNTKDLLRPQDSAIPTLPIGDSKFDTLLVVDKRDYFSCVVKAIDDAVASSDGLSVKLNLRICLK